jgi:hypothetical protein
MIRIACKESVRSRRWKSQSRVSTGRSRLQPGGARRARWGRGYEGYSEDPAIVRPYAGRRVHGLQGTRRERSCLDGTRPSILSATAAPSGRRCCFECRQTAVIVNARMWRSWCSGNPLCAMPRRHPLARLWGGSCRRASCRCRAVGRGLAYSWPRGPEQTGLDRHDRNYDPLFAYGFGLAY